MIRNFFVVALAFVLMVLQIPVLHLLGLRNFSIDVTLCATIFVASTTPGALGLVFVSLLGLMTDFFMPGGLTGMQMEIQVVIFMLARVVLSRLQLNRVVPLMLVISVASIVSLLLFMLLSVIFDRAYSHSSTVLLSGLAQTLATAVFAPLVFKLFAIADGGSHRKRDSRSLFV